MGLDDLTLLEEPAAPLTGATFVLQAADGRDGGSVASSTSATERLRDAASRILEAETARTRRVETPGGAGLGCFETLLDSGELGLESTIKINIILALSNKVLRDKVLRNG